jgi:hypothetical protein
MRVQFFGDVLTAYLDFAFSSAGLCEVVSHMHPQPRFSRAAESRIAILGLMPDLPLTIFVRVCRVTSRTFAPLVTDKPKGSRHALFTIRPGWAGFFIGMAALSFLISDSRSIQRQTHLHLESGK